jgi:hypothetical protein
MVARLIAIKPLTLSGFGGHPFKIRPALAIVSPTKEEHMGRS